MKNPEVFYTVRLFLLFMYVFAVQFSPEGLEHSTAFLFIPCESFFELACFNFFYKSSKKEKIIFKSDLYDLNLFHFKVRVLISWRVYRQKVVNFNKQFKTF
jgi:hypothetical protein